MASTAEGKALTAAHQKEQQRLGVRAIAEARARWSLLDIDDLDASTPYWLAATAGAVDRLVRQSQSLAARYLTRYRAAEVGTEGRVVLGASTATASALMFSGPVRVKRLIAAGMPAEEAYERAFVKVGGIASRQTLMGGRTTIANTASADRRAVGWRRVTDGNPCAFCATLASRGPVYKSRNSTIVQGQGLRYHGHCGCTAEVVYGTWTPTADEERYLAAYEEAAKAVTRAGARRDLNTILAKMREDGAFH